MTMWPRSFFPLSLCCALCACATSKNAAKASADRTGNGTAIIIKGSDLNAGVLETLRYRVPNMRVGTPPGSRCPRIVFRAERSINNQRDPSIYIDGTRMSDTCALLDVAATDVDHIEVYVSGMTPYAQIERNPFGTILIYRRRE